MLFAAAATAGVLMLRRDTQRPYDGPTRPATREVLRLTIVERGALESAENSDVVVRVKSGTKGSTAATNIKWVIDDGTPVEKGQLIVELDDSGLQDQLRTQINVVNQAQAAWIQADENLQIVQSQNFSDNETAKVTRVLAEIALRKYLGETATDKLAKMKTRDEVQKYLLTDYEADARKEQDKALEEERKATAGSQQEGAKPRRWVSDFLQSLNEIEGRIETTRSDYEQLIDRAEWSGRMARKGFVSRSQSESDRSRREAKEFELKKVQGEFDILRKFTLEHTATDLWSKLAEADRALERVKTQARSKEVQADIDRKSKREVFIQEDFKKADIEDQIAKCTILAPQSGLIVYYVSEQSRFGSGSQQSIVAQGEPVREGQKLMRIPNLNKMLVNVRVHEAMISKVKGEITRATGFGDSVRAGLYMGKDPYSLLVNKFAFDESRDQYKEHEHELLYPGQTARVRVDAFAGESYKAHVKNVATVASQTDFLSSDVKVYQTLVGIDDEVENLKPGMSAEVTILADESGAEVITIPIQSVVGNIAMGAKRKAYVLDGDRIPRERDIVVGMSNETLVEVKSGLEEGELVVLNPAKLIPEESNMKPGTPGATRRGSESGGPGGPGAGKKGMKKGGPDGAPGGPGSPGMVPGGPGGPGGLPPGGPGGGTGGLQGGPPAEPKGVPAARKQ